MANIYMRFPKGKVKAVTLSYDDGVETDARLIEIMQKSGLKGTFNINSGLYAAEGTVYPKGAFHRRMTRRQALELYQGSGMEIAVHTCTHPYLEELPESLCVEEILADRKSLEADFGGMIRGMAYPYGTYNESVVRSARQCGIVYSRTVNSTHGFGIPENWLTLHPTCHHTEPELFDLCRGFIENDRGMKPMLFYLWGHSFEFERDDNWELIEKFAALMGSRPDYWYATNMEVYEYVTAYQQLVFSADASKVMNPTNMVLYLQREDEIYAVNPGETVAFG